MNTGLTSCLVSKGFESELVLGLGLPGLWSPWLEAPDEYQHGGNRDSGGHRGTTVSSVLMRALLRRGLEKCRFSLLVPRIHTKSPHNGRILTDSLTAWYGEPESPVHCKDQNSPHLRFLRACLVWGSPECGVGIIARQEA